MKRRELLIGAWALVVMRSPVLAQKAVAVPRIGLLWIVSADDSMILTAFRDGLRAQGYVDGRTIRIDTGSLVDRFDLMPEAADRLVREGVDVIVCYGATATLAAHKATSAVPIVSVTGGDPVKMGVVATLAKPGGNVTGVTFLHPQLDAKRLEVLQEAVPKIHRVGLLLNPASATEPTNVPRWTAAAKTLNLEVQPVGIRLQGDIDKVIFEVAQYKVDALALVAGTMFMANRKQIVAAIAKIRLPAVYGSVEYAEAGGLISYGPSVPDGLRRAAGHVAKILKGAKPADIPFEQATKFELAINLKTARALGITIPQSLLVKADRLIE
jgi:putative ABC transport system substrate-binding protein